MVHRTISLAFGKPLLILTLSLSKGEEWRAQRVSRSSGPAKATNAASLGERPDDTDLVRYQP